MAERILPSLSSQGIPIALDIQSAKATGHQDMTFTLNDVNNTIIPFKLNPQEYQSIEQPLEVAAPTNAGFYVFRWQILPTQYQIRVYCGLQGSKMEPLVDQLVGQTDILWSYPYLNKSRRVRILTIKRIRSSESPYGTIYDISMQENNPLVKITQGKITQTRINSSFLSPTVYTPDSVNSVSVDFIDIQTQWDSLTDAVLAISKAHPNSNIPAAAQYNFMLLLNNNMFKTSSSPLTGWKTIGGPKDNTGLTMTRLRYAAGSIGNTNR